MTAAQAQAMSGQLVANGIAHSVVVSFTGGGAASYNIELNPSVTYTGTQLQELANYVIAQGLTLTLVPESMGVV